MDENHSSASDFEALLFNQGNKKSLDIYSNDGTTKTNNGGRNPFEYKYSAKGILHSVATTLKDIQSADRVKYDRNVLKKLSSHKKSALLPLSSLYSVVQECKTPLQTNKFETQCVTDTQLINIVEDAEAMAQSDRDISQEFETSFCYPVQKDKSLILGENSPNDDKSADLMLDDDVIRNNDYDLNIEKPNEDTRNEENVNEQHVCTISQVLNPLDKRQDDIINIAKDLQNGDKILKANSQESKEKDLKIILYESIEIETNLKHLGALLEETEKSVSPVLSISSFRRKPTSQCLVYDLEVFENFERMTLPQLTSENNTSIGTIEQIMDSHHIDKDFDLYSLSVDEERSLSPILFKKQKEDKLQNKEEVIGVRGLNKEDIIQKEENIDKEKELDSIQKSKDESKTYEDEILFSSDEEMDYVHKIGQDLPLTCALDTSFYNNQSSILEKTIFVGFQTASNKSIQIHTHSLERAKNILEDDEVRHSKMSLTELVNKKVCEINDKKDATRELDEHTLNEIATEEPPMSKDVVKLKLQEEDAKLNDYSPEFKLPNENKDIPAIKDTDIQKYLLQGLEMARKKNIILSAKARTRVKSVFQDLDLEVFDDTKPKDSLLELKDTEEYKDIRESKNSITSVEKERFGGFKTASNKNIQFSTKAKARIKSVFKDIDLDDVFDDNVKPQEFQAVVNLNTNSITHNPPGSVQPISDRNIVRSQKAIDDNRTLLNDVEFGETFNNEMENENVEQLGLKCENTLKTEEEANMNADREESIKESKETLKDVTSIFQGFKTASNKQITISKEALTKTRKILQDIEKDDKQECGEMEFIGFQTASNKKVKISDEALAKTKRIFENIDNHLLIDINCDKNIAFGGFQTASNKKVEISEEALAKTKGIFENIENESVSHINSQRDKGFAGFHTANNKKVKISEEALAKSKHIVEKNENDSNKNLVFSGFQTASNKKIEIPTEALAKTKRIFENIDNEISDKVSDKVIGFSGIQTASSKKVKISEEALGKTKQILENIFNDLESETNNNKNITFSGFQTASNKKVEISEEALAKTKRIFANIDSDRVPDKVTDNDIGFCSFQTASSKKVKISEEALAKTKRIFENIKKDKCMYDVPEINVNKNTAFSGFQTASNKKVVVTDEMLAKTKNIFQEMTQKENIDKLRNKPDLLSFKTDNNGKVQVSEEAMSKSPPDIDQYVNKVTQNSKTMMTNIMGKADFNAEEMDTEKYINTQVMHNFEQTLNTEDFVPKSPKLTKRAGSPILSCPRAKKRKCFKTPYNAEAVKTTTKDKEKIEKSAKTQLEFDKNYKKHKIFKLKDLAKLENESTNQANTDPYILGFSFDDLLNFEFSNERNGITDSELTIEELKELFLASVNRKIVPNEWLDIQVRLILWKLISYEIRFPKVMSKTCNAKAVIDQLKYRYDRELYNVERPALRKVLEKDDTSARTMVLCVVGFYVDGVSVTSVTNPSCSLELLLTDGWYTIRATADRRLTQLACEGQVKVGGKLTTHGAELVGCEQGVAPWEDTSQIRLRLSANSTRPCRWSRRLGLHGAAPPPGPLRRAAPGGGRSAVRVCVARVYPQLYLERKEDGGTVTRSEKLEQIYQARYEADRQAKLERVYEEIEREFAEQSHLTFSQAYQLQTQTERERDRLLAQIQERAREKISEAGLCTGRNVVNLLKIRVADVESSSGLISIWKPSDGILDIVQEGRWIDVTNVVPTTIRNSELQLSAGRQTTFNLTKTKENDKYKDVMKSLQRTCFTINDICKNPNMKHHYNEIDTVGIVVSIEPSNKDFESIKNQHFQNVYLASFDKEFICVTFWGGVVKFGFENVVEIGEVVSCSNIQKRLGKCRNIPEYRATELSFFSKTPKNLNSRNMVEDLVKKIQGIDRRKFCDDCLDLKNKFSLVKHNNTENMSPYRFHNTGYNLSKNMIFIGSPIPKLVQNEKDELNLTGLDFESTFKQRDTQEMTPEEMKRKKIVGEKIAKLKMYGEPPPLSPVLVLNKSKNASSSYKCPLPPNSVQKNENLQRSSENVAQRNENLLRSSETLAKRNKILPRSNENIPQSKENLAQKDTILPQSNESIPRSNENIPRSDENMPRSNQNIARSKENLPQSNENVPRSNGNHQQRPEIIMQRYDNPLQGYENLSTASPITIFGQVSSPVRTYEDRSGVNPVKLNFSNSAADEGGVSLEHFAEDFDDSAPLSLDDALF